MRHVKDEWLDLATDALHDFSPHVEWAHVGALLAETLHMSVAGDFSWTPRTPGALAGFSPSVEYDLPDVAARASKFHPLARHYAATHSPQVLAIHQVPMLATSAEREYLAELASLGIDQHLWIPLPPQPSGLHVCGGCRASDPFTRQEIATASELQRLLRAIDQHAAAVGRWQARLVETEAAAQTPARVIGESVGLTARQVAVLDLTADGLTSSSIARRLGISPRTVEKHLEAAYRALGVRERVSAVQRAQAAGVIARARHPHRDDTGAGGVGAAQARRTP